MIISKIKFLFAILIITSITVLVTVCQNRQPVNADKPQPKVLPKVESFDKAQTFQIKPQELPAPFATESARRNSKVVEQTANATLKLPKGFRINVYA
nr:hypothetical protein [Pyrinomonadaceae bacterium]